MSDIPLYDEDDDLPAPRSRAEMRFENVSVQPYADGRRVKLKFRFPPFLERPSVEATVTNLMGQPVASMSLIEAMDQEFEFTLHLRGPQPQGEHTLRLILFYPDSDETPTDARHIVDEHTLRFDVPSPY
jgi:hypothetical protein